MRTSFRSWPALCVALFAASCGKSNGGGFPAPLQPQQAPTIEAIEAAERDELIDDFEDSDLLAWLPDGEGHWTSEADGEGLSIVGEGSDGARSLQVEPAAGRAIANLSFVDAPLRRHDYSSCSGLELTVRNDGAGSVVTTVVIDSVQVDGDNDSRGLASAAVQVNDEWTIVNIAWDDFAPLGSDSELPSGAGGAAGAPGGLTARAAGASGAPGGSPGVAGGAGTPGAGTGGNPADPSVPLPELDEGHILAISIAALPEANLLIDSVRLTDCELLPLNLPLPEPPELGSNAPDGSPVAIHGQLRVKGAHLYDQNGDLVQLKGVSSMWLNYETEGFAESKDGLRWMRDNWGLEIVRAAMGAGDRDANVAMTNSYTQQPDILRAQVETIIENAVELGVYVIVDWHSHETHAPEARAFFDDIAARYGEHPNVIYETFNEPVEQEWLGELKPYHESVVAAIRAQDPDNLIVLGTPFWAQRVSEAARNPVGGSNLLYTVHFYSCTHDEPSWIIGNSNRAMDNGVAVFATEWGASTADGGISTKTVCTDMAIEYLEWMEDEGISWAAWRLDNCADTTCFFKSSVQNVDGDWTENDLQGHAPLVIEWMQR